ncbi:hypothetical protein RDV89_12265 [Nocardioides zeae]|uniref:DUF4439 domain-containing protein n=1 Tax=Nocardioides imazamoxiresistens TaxID=3231893 RepID=A0ABU3PX79_9ACTN|nr:hypothetical protein [Nocardioides zeae]MDT9593848.1 hypothetical protein [Nocardioides zeae]
MPTRRTALTAPLAVLGVVGLAGLAGCRDGAGGNGTDAPADAVDADSAVVDEAVRALATARVAVSTAAAPYPEVTATVGPLLALHDAQLMILDADDAGIATPSSPTSAPTSSPATPAASPDEALAAVREVETDLTADLVVLAVTAGSGALARTLATMAAAVDQHLLGLVVAP